mmetsp:Transcript_34024/g.33189  ORF Transcript_34024/g.33189 Transcript_34024/m.33189 type:complete len:110 (-) Transcript_34024:423-752(-)
MKSAYYHKQNDGSSSSGTRCILLCMDFISYPLGHSIQSDVIFGSNLGEISTFNSGKHFVLNEGAHGGAINVIRATDSLQERIIILTGGEDGLLKIWDVSIKLLQVLDMT